ncbi:MAG: hypothetical protein HT580_16105 [Dechloromonas sp.]|nr:MAG: hypothetical protein HT580_16105 [Dechloromonas sp.]
MIDIERDRQSFLSHAVGRAPAGDGLPYCFREFIAHDKPNLVGNTGANDWSVWKFMIGCNMPMMYGCNMPISGDFHGAAKQQVERSAWPTT